ncbi:mitochondrial carrier domain-containing protein [Lanmaoa asiatica]|nr:mitochondrial carrier domain-containing protein [Lanmaoa asiatica]KAH0834269.1 mitochondrial carrier domain-containing protein [Lanmaoa asiatica]
MASPLLGIAGVNSLLFAAYVASKRIVSPFPDLSIQQVALAGGMAGAINAILASPVWPLTFQPTVEMFKVRMQGQYGSAGDKRLRTVAKEMWKEWGFTRGIMRGYWVTVVREVPAYAGWVTWFEFSKRQFQGIYGQQVPVWALLASGSTGGIAYWLSCYPLDVIKSRIQLRPTPPTSRPWTYINEELKAVVSEGGLCVDWMVVSSSKGLFRGLSHQHNVSATQYSEGEFQSTRKGYANRGHGVPYSIPAAGSTFAAYELTREFLRESTGA